MYIPPLECAPVSVADDTKNPRSDRDARGAQIPFLLVRLKSGIDVAPRLLELPREHHGVLDRHACPLGQVLQGGVRGIAEQPDVAAPPPGPRLALVQHPLLVLADPPEPLLPLRRRSPTDLP